MGRSSVSRSCSGSAPPLLDAARPPAALPLGLPEGGDGCEARPSADDALPSPRAPCGAGGCTSGASAISVGRRPRGFAGDGGGRAAPVAAGLHSMEGGAGELLAVGSSAPGTSSSGTLRGMGHDNPNERAG
eukprot:CAMPEP_0179119300 /NCGR_PEP_ID=MMETSP0796-20121207/56153_1 /TAXON_ID=73915 /ORGANISM="Pyrodinium bahamense, Strain pbaha01" /LENGTH=130 /DNA_ID=CAMNT_0020817795 /DNA_START=142 /DNA_END=531 /DNA_ORIENTATION=-